MPGRPKRCCVAYVAAAVISQQLPNVLCSCMTGCDANSGFYGKRKKSCKSPVARRQLSPCRESLDLEEEVVTRHVIYGDNKSSTIAEARAAKWKRMKNKLFIRFPPDADRIRQHCLRAKYWAYLMRHPSLRHSDMAGSWWVVPVALSATRDLLSRRTNLHQGKQKRTGKMTTRRRRREMMMYRGGLIYLNLMIQNVVRYNALIRAGHIS